MFKDIYKAANNEITPDKQLMKKILSYSKKNSFKNNFISLYAAALAMILICISLNPLYLTIAKKNAYDKDAALTDFSGINTSATAAKQKSVFYYAFNDSVSDDENFNKSLQNIESLPSKEARSGGYTSSDRVLNLPEDFKETKESKNSIFSFSSASGKKVLYSNSSLPLLNPSNTNSYLIGKSKTYIYKNPPLFYAEFSSGYKNYINIWAENLTEEEFYNLIK